MKDLLKTHGAWLLPLLLFAAITPFISDWDMGIERYFHALGKANGTDFVSNGFTQFMYIYGVLPADVTVTLAAIALVLSYCFKKWRKWRAPALLLVLTLALGGGVISHALLKDHWGRPRPKQVVEFGGTQEFRPYYKPNFFHQPESSKAFVCGHCTTGFFFFALALAGRRMNNKKIYYLGIFLAIVLGTLLGIARMAMGGHFLSDVLGAALVMWLTTLFCDWLVYTNSYDNPEPIK